MKPPGTTYSLAIRRLDGTPPVQLGLGSGGSLSPDGKWAISVLVGGAGRVTLVPTGPGQPRTIPTPGLERIYNGNVHFLPDGKHITLNANEPGHKVRCYLVDLEGGKPIPITPEGITGALISPDGKYILRNDNGAATRSILPPEVHPVPSPVSKPGFIPVQWSEDNSSVYGYIRGQFQQKFTRSTW